MIDFEDKEKNFEDDPLMDWEPVERLNNWGDVF